MSDGKVLFEVGLERERQDAKWGKQNHPNGTSRARWSEVRDVQRIRTDARAAAGLTSFADILREEVYEALAEEAPAALRAELIQVAAVAVAWVEAIDRRG